MIISSLKLSKYDRCKDYGQYINYWMKRNKKSLGYVSVSMNNETMILKHATNAVNYDLLVLRIVNINNNFDHLNLLINEPDRVVVYEPHGRSNSYSTRQLRQLYQLLYQLFNKRIITALDRIDGHQVYEHSDKDTYDGFCVLFCLLFAEYYINYGLEYAISIIYINTSVLIRTYLSELVNYPNTRLYQNSLKFY
jgi:hypothetical protein